MKFIFMINRIKLFMNLSLKNWWNNCLMLGGFDDGRMSGDNRWCTSMPALINRLSNLFKILY